MSFIEICIYEVKPEKTEEFEQLLREVKKHHKSFPGVKSVRYIKRTHRFSDFESIKKGKPAIRLTKKPKTVKYVLYWELKDEKVHGRATKSGLEKYYRRFRRCLPTYPKIILGETL